jgi:hypothetical protein
MKPLKERLQLCRSGFEVQLTACRSQVKSSLLYSFHSAVYDPITKGLAVYSFCEVTETSIVGVPCSTWMDGWHLDKLLQRRLRFLR